jgi:peptidyl-prolyl cis-trans isomerase SurA
VGSGVKPSAGEPVPLDGPPLEAAPAAAQSTIPTEGPADARAPSATALPGGTGNSTAVDKPADRGGLAGMLPLEPAPSSMNVLPAATARGTAPWPSAPRTDSQVVRTAMEKPESPAKEPKHAGKKAGHAVARVGEEIITFHDLIVATRENLKKYPELKARAFNSAEQLEVSRATESIAKHTLQSLIDRSLLAQEAKHHIDSKNLGQVYQEADKFWRDQEVLPLERRYNVDSEYKLKERLAEEGRSLDAMRLEFRQVFLAESYLQQKLKEHLKVELPDLLKYYNEHVQKREFDHPAQITWRELVVEVEKYPSRAAAEQKAAALLERLKKGEDFAKLAKTESDGPTASKNRGGMMKTSPGAYAVAAVNQALESLPLNQTSGLLSGPDSFHIVRVENRRAAGAASFEEVQDKIKPILVNEKYQVQRNAVLAKLRRNTLIEVYL